MSIAKEVRQWLAELKRKSNFRVLPIALKDSKEWLFLDGKIRHKSGKFFNIIGVKKIINEKQIERVLIDQREIGTLGFLLRGIGNGRELLVQAKIEPGNIGIIQLAPTLQATHSNARCFHGGTAPRYLNFFHSAGKNIIYDKLKSEQGTRFFQKRNRNVLIEAGKKAEESPWHKWIKVEDLLDLLKVNYLVNTDARSVLTCVPWDVLVGREPFSRYQDEFGADLMKSYQTSSGGNLEKAKKCIKKKQQESRKNSIVPLGKLKEWVVEDVGISSVTRGTYSIKYIFVHALGREVSSWDQPIIDSKGEGCIFLECGRINGILNFLFQTKEEIGLYDKVELTPTIVTEPGVGAPNYDSKGKIVRAECRQSEEGGRFFQDINLFRIVDVGEAYPAPEGYHWLTLNDIAVLLKEEGWLTNEARSALSLLLPWL